MEEKITSVNQALSLSKIWGCDSVLADLLGDIRKEMSKPDEELDKEILFNYFEMYLSVAKKQKMLAESANK